MSYIYADTAEATIPFHHASSTREAVVVVGYTCSTTPGALVAYCDSILASFNDAYGDALDSQVTLGPVRVRARPPGVSEPITAEGSETATDGTTGDTLPSNCALLIRKGTNRGGRRGRGRMYIPWSVGDGACSDTGVLDPALVSSYQSRSNDFLTTVVGDADDVLTLLHADIADGINNDLTSLTVDNLIATQRRRLGR